MSEKLENGRFVGLDPWLPWPLCLWSWWTQPVRAERLAALRIGLALALLIDIVVSYLPEFHDWFGPGSLGSADLFGWYTQSPRWHWSIFRGPASSLHRLLAEPWDNQRAALQAGVLVWLAAVILLMVGFWTRVSAVTAWVLSVSFANLNPNIDNAGDGIRGIILLYLMLCPCGAVWSLDAWRARHRAPASGPVLVSPWALRLLFVQMTLIYFCNGFYKMLGSDWRSGESLYYVMCDLTLARWSYDQFAVPFWLTRVLSWSVLVWELGFPLWVAAAQTRAIALWFGVAFHLGIMLSLELGGFGPYMLTLYLPLVPWERLAERGRR